MSIKSQRNQIDIPNVTIKNQRSPNYQMDQVKIKKPKLEQIDSMSSYVERNLQKAVKPRGTEYR